MRSQRRQHGYSLVEMLVVLAIIGLMSVITVPQFINYRESLRIKSALRVLNSDFINARQLAITRYWQVKIEFPTTNTYKFYYRSGNSGAWSDLTASVLNSGTGRINGLTGNTKKLDGGLTFVQGAMTVGGTSYAAMSDVDNNTYPDVVFSWDGSAQLSADNTQGTACVTLKSPRSKLPQDEMVSIIYSSGKLSSAGTHS